MRYGPVTFEGTWEELQKMFRNIKNEKYDFAKINCYLVKNYSEKLEDPVAERVQKIEQMLNRREMESELEDEIKKSRISRFDQYVLKKGPEKKVLTAGDMEKKCRDFESNVKNKNYLHAKVQYDVIETYSEDLGIEIPENIQKLRKRIKRR